MIIDAYSHVCPARLTDAIGREYPSAEAAALDGKPLLRDADERIRFMDEVGVDVQVLVLVRPPMWLGMPSEVMYRMMREAHLGIAAMVEEHPDRFIGTAVAPTCDDRVLEELRFAWDELGLVGAEIFSNVEGQPLDSPHMWPLYEEAERRSMPLWIHPQHTSYLYPWIKESLLDRSLGWPFDTSLAMLRLVYGGVMERFPNLRIITHHLGGMIPYYGARLASFDTEIAEYRSRNLTGGPAVTLSAPVTEYLRRFYNDTSINYSPATLSCGLDFFGGEHVLFGTDFPMGSLDGGAGTREALRAIQDCPLTPEVRSQLLEGNARRLLLEAAPAIRALR